MAVTKLAQELGEAMIALDYGTIVDKKNHQGDKLFGILDPKGDSYPDRYGFDSHDTVGSFVDKRFSEEVLAALITHPDNPLGVSVGTNKASTASIQALIQQDPWIASDFRRLTATGGFGEPAWDSFILPTYRRLFPSAPPVVTPPVDLPPAGTVGPDIPEPPALLGVMFARALENWQLGTGKHAAMVRMQSIWNAYVEAIAKAKGQS